MRISLAVVVVASVLAFVAAPVGDAAKKKTQPVTITLLAGSTSTLDLGAGNVRTIPLTGVLKGTADGKINITKPIHVKLTKARIVPGPITVFDDPTCPATPILTTHPASLVTLDRTHKRKSSSVLSPKDGRVTGTAATRLRIALNVRGAGCGGPLVPTGYADTFQRFTVKGKLDPKTGLTSLILDSSAKPIEIQGCTTAGDPAKKCAGKPIGYKGKISVHLVVRVELGGPPAPTSP